MERLADLDNLLSFEALKVHLASFPEEFSKEPAIAETLQAFQEYLLERQEEILDSRFLVIEFTLK